MSKLIIYQGLELSEFKIEKLEKRSLSNVNEIILHCSATDNKKTTISDIHAWHLKRNMAGCGYHFFIDSFGNIYSGRSLNYKGAHCRNHNSRTIGICVNGLTKFNQKQANSLKILIRNIPVLMKKYLKKRGQISLITPHNQYDKRKTCPVFDVDTFKFEGKLVVL